MVDNSQTTDAHGPAATRLQNVLQRMAAAATRAGRAAKSVRLVAVSKTHPAEALLPLVAAGQMHFGENRVQEAVTKAQELSHLPIQWHLVGQLQSNKAAAAARLFHWIHSVDNLRLARRLSAAAASGGRELNILVQVSLSADSGRGGVLPAALPKLLASIKELPALNLRGLMLLPPVAAQAESARPCFRHLTELAQASVEQQLLPPSPELSMGMSGDYEVAVAEGATLVRVGTALFGSRKPLSN